MIRDIFFEVPTQEAADELTKLCLAEGWTVSSVHHYEAGVPYDYGRPGVPSFVPTRTCSSLTAHKADFDYDEIEAVHTKADELAAKVGGECTGGGCAIGEGDYQEREDTIEWVADAQPILDVLGASVDEHPVVSLRDMVMQIRAQLVEAGWTPPPRVFLEGDDIPSHLPVIANGEVRDDYKDYDEGVDDDVYTANYDVVEMNIDYDAAVARAKRERRVR